MSFVLAKKTFDARFRLLRPTRHPRTETFARCGQLVGHLETGTSLRNVFHDSIVLEHHLKKRKGCSN